jgi:hypothetical protein
MKSRGVNGDVQTLGDELFDPLGYVRVYSEVDGVHTHLFCLGETVGNIVDPDDAGCTFDESPVGDTESDGSQSLKKRYHYSC